MEHIEDKENFQTSDLENETDEEALRRFENEELGSARIKKLRMILPVRLMLVLGLQFLFLAVYYMGNCIRHEDGSWVSKPMYLPSDLTYNPFKLMFGVAMEQEDQPFWTMEPQR
eukprot:TRINITY_DN115329_c0_g1_i1.p1 TRINITY_DN115329_c0_g1~~TRINITY_DN115329_c0_g1_i1.p1  ORF type:complete len:114 (-),score=11.09 TRINITY_DN115329_c0_g1_i1:86-427(-)